MIDVLYNTGRTKVFSVFFQYQLPYVARPCHLFAPNQKVLAVLNTVRFNKEFFHCTHQPVQVVLDGAQ